MEGENEAELVFDFKLGIRESNDIWVDIHNNTKGNYTTIRSKRYFWLKLPVTIEPTSDTVQFQVEGLDDDSRLKQYPYTGVAKCSTGMLSVADPLDGANGSHYACRGGDPATPNFKIKHKHSTVA